MDTDRQPDAAAKPRMSYACEACRAAKVKCQPGTAPGICRRCLDSKRECIFKTGPRTRRPRQSKLNAAAPRPPPPPGPSQTFTIDVPMPATDDALSGATNPVDALCTSHETYLSRLVDSSEDDLAPPPSLTSSSSWAPTPSSSVSGTTTNNSIRAVQPRFNLDSASALLRTFLAVMLPRFPVAVFPESTSVPDLARDRPFVLLAALAAASGRGGPAQGQGHGLYDEEFRRVLGVKFVSGGERSVEMLVGLLIYVAWYPFHLRPKSRQAFQYIRMAIDIVHDLELDHPPSGDASLLNNAVSEEMLAGIRAYLACYYLGTSFEISWSKGSSVGYTQWTATCCDILEMHSGASEGDRTLVWLVRLQHLAEETAKLRNSSRSQPQGEHHKSLLLKGIETQLREWQGRMPNDMPSTSTLKIALLFTEVFLYGASLLRPPSARGPSIKHAPSNLPEPWTDTARLTSCVAALRTFLEYMVSLPSSEFSAFCAVDWGRFVVSIVLGFRISFPLPGDCPTWDDEAARRRLDLGAYLDRFAASPGPESDTHSASSPSQQPDTLSASRAVLAVVKQKYDRRVAHLSSSGRTAPPDRAARGCPVIDGSMDAYFRSWDETPVDPGYAVLPGLEPGAHGEVYHDLWATMTAGWASDGVGDMDMVSL
ncbi:Zn(II)2Cys6 transcription factor [Pleurostoma richardsiae]|uniref:Zn(II)2Cys6 transcription factor n=1 Tax=Pleurostoma richardsiae TaxID=41990 RepID=A0AA38RQW1_9PEZI|nr:Zn(II)2Cys6 transcription factor [Pleurostoma richardsiae]